MFILNDTLEVALHEVQAQVEHRRPVPGYSIVDYLVDVQDVGVVESLQKFDLAERGDGEAEFTLIFQVLHFLEGVVAIILEILGLVH